MPVVPKIWTLPALRSNSATSPASFWRSVAFSRSLALKALPITLQVVCPMLKHGPVLQWLRIRADESATCWWTTSRPSVTWTRTPH